jgi:NitT/TauT family transport system substrate-binding protein
LPAAPVEGTRMIRACTRLAVLLGIVAITAAGAGAQPAQLFEFNYGNLGPNANEWPMYIAEQQGYFREEGLKVNTISFTGVGDLVTAVATGAIHSSGTQTDTGIAAIVNGADIRIIGPSFRVVPYRLVVAPSVTSWQQLKGATVSLGSKSGSSVIAYHRLLKAHGIPDSDISMVVAGTTAARLAALKSGAVQATMLLQPGDFLAVKDGLKIMDESDGVMRKDWVWAVTITNNKWAQANRPILVHYLRALRKAYQYGYSHREQSIALLEKNVKVDREIAEKTYDLLFRKWQGFERDLRVDPASLTNISNYLLSEGSITRVPAVGEIYDPSYAQAALR